MKSGYMIQRKSTKHFVTVSKKNLVTIPNPDKCMKFYDEKSAMIFMHFMISTMGAIAQEYEIGMQHHLGVPDLKPQKSMLAIDNKKGKRWFK